MSHTTIITFGNATMLPVWQDERVWLLMSLMGQRGLLVLSCARALSSTVRFSYLYFLTNICPLLNRKHWIRPGDHDSGWDSSPWVLIIHYRWSWCYRPQVKHAGRILRRPRRHTGVLQSFPFVKITSAGSPCSMRPTTALQMAPV